MAKKQINLSLTDDELEQLDAIRKTHTFPPTRAAMAREMMKRALAAESRKLVRRAS
jgi:hypothetical protein